MPEEIFIIIVLGILSVTSLVVVGQIRQYLEAKNGFGSGTGTGSGSSMKTSELEAMVERAAHKAIQPVVKRVENIESIMSDEDLPDLLSDADTYFESDPVKSRIKVTRSEDRRRS